MNIQTQDQSTATGNGEIYVLVFKTNVRFKKDLNTIKSYLSSNPDILTWSIDRQDVDKVLRVESLTDNTSEIIKIITNSGFCCEELTY